jgi:NADH-quinone oxidoreductase subunit C
MDETLHELGEAIRRKLPDAVEGTSVALGWLEVRVRADRIVDALRLLRDDPDCRFTQLTDIAGVDHPGRERRFDVVYHLLSMHKNRRIRVKVAVGEEEAAPSAVSVFPCADWFEREVFDMYGVVFDDHPDLRRILTDYGFQGHPFRKDFPLTGYVELRYDEDQKRVVYEPVKLQQEFRRFDFLSPWEGARYILPGDEKAHGEMPGAPTPAPAPGGGKN